MIYTQRQKRSWSINGKLIIPTIFLLLSLTHSIVVAQDNIEADSVKDNLDVKNEKPKIDRYWDQHDGDMDGGQEYGYLNVGGHMKSDSLNHTTVIEMVMGFDMYSEFVYYEYRFRLVRLVRFKARRDNDRLAVTPLVQLGLAYPLIGISAIAGDWNSDFTGALFKYWLMLFGSQVSLRPHQNFAVFAGVTPEFLLFTDDDGMLFQFRVGTRFLIAPPGYMLEVEAVRNRFWAWDQESRTFGWGFGVNLLLDLGSK